MSEAPHNSSPADESARGSNRERKSKARTTPRANLPGIANPERRTLDQSDLPPDEGSGRGFSYEWEATTAQITQQLAEIDSVDSFDYVQAPPAAVWTIVHGLNGYPDVLVLDNTGRKLYADVQYPDDQTVVVSHDHPYSGTAKLRL